MTDLFAQHDSPAKRSPADDPEPEWRGRERRRPITVALVDDEELIRVALADVLTGGGLELVGEATTGEDAIELGVSLRPDVVLMDLNLPGMPGIRVIEHLRELAPASGVLVLTRNEQNLVVEAIIAGARGYILKTAGPDAILAAVRATARGEAVISSQIAGRLLERIRDQSIPVVGSRELDAAAIRATLTSRELEIFTRLASGETNSDIGRELMLSPNTVANHIASILAKLQLENRIQAAVRAVRAGIA